MRPARHRILLLGYDWVYTRASKFIPAGVVRILINIGAHVQNMFYIYSLEHHTIYVAANIIYKFHSHIRFSVSLKWYKGWCSAFASEFVQYCNVYCCWVVCFAAFRFNIKSSIIIHTTTSHKWTKLEKFRSEHTWPYDDIWYGGGWEITHGHGHKYVRKYQTLRRVCSESTGWKLMSTVIDKAFVC